MHVRIQAGGGHSNRGLYLDESSLFEELTHSADGVRSACQP